MTFATWWRGDHLPALSSLPTFSARLSTDSALIARLTNRTSEIIATRLRAGSRPYLAFIGETPVACGWVATQAGRIADLQFSFKIPAQNGYLFSFLTLPRWRGRGIYPHLLQSIIHQEPQIERFWIAYMPGNLASGRGISKAGFQAIGDFHVIENHVAGLTLFDSCERGQTSADVFQLPIVTTP